LRPSDSGFCCEKAGTPPFPGPATFASNQFQTPEKNQMKYVALLRGINVGGHNKIKMDELRKMFVSIGFQNVKSYINSGNIIFDNRKTGPVKLVQKIEKGIENTFSLNIKVVVREMAAIKDLVSENPFKDRMTGDRNLFIAFLSKGLSAENQQLLLSNNNEFEEFAILKQDVFCLSEKGFRDGLLGQKYIDKKLKTTATVRNWRTVNKILEF
jgi:uncharacterized protein (DUF1697 family)